MSLADLTVSDEVVIAFISAAVFALLTTVGILWKIILNIASDNRAERERLRKIAEEAETKHKQADDDK